QVFADLSSGKLPLDPSGVLNSELDRNEKVFQAKMTMILMKYDKPFEDDLLIDIASLTYDTPNGKEVFATDKSPWEISCEWVNCSFNRLIVGAKKCSLVQ
ncbi:hypothetical protein FKM82_030151, partial [Ascaphus truei]